MSVAAQLLTAEEFAILPGSRHQELVFGEVVETMPPGGIHGEVALTIGMFLKLWLRQVGLGVAGVESGFILARDPDLVRSPDVYFVRAERVPADGVPESFWPLAPDLAVEVVSPSDTAEEVEAKVGEYLSAGSGAVWVVYPRLRRLVAHSPGGIARSYGERDTLENAELLPGFALVLAEIFSR
jgi:Uma2 family endonuclease